MLTELLPYLDPPSMLAIRLNHQLILLTLSPAMRVLEQEEGTKDPKATTERPKGATGPPDETVQECRVETREDEAVRAALAMALPEDRTAEEVMVLEVPEVPEAREEVDMAQEALEEDSRAVIIQQQGTPHTAIILRRSKLI